MSKNYQTFYGWISIIIVGIFLIRTAVTESANRNQDDSQRNLQAHHGFKENLGQKFKGNLQNLVSVKENPLENRGYSENSTKKLKKSQQSSLISESLKASDYEARNCEKTIQNQKISDSNYREECLLLNSLESEHKTLTNKKKNVYLDPTNFQQNLNFSAKSSYQNLKTLKENANPGQNLKLNTYHRHSKHNFTTLKHNAKRFLLLKPLQKPSKATILNSNFANNKLNFLRVKESPNPEKKLKVNEFRKYLHQDSTSSKQDLKNHFHLNLLSSVKKLKHLKTEKIQKSTKGSQSLRFESDKQNLKDLIHMNILYKSKLGNVRKIKKYKRKLASNFDHFQPKLKGCPELSYLNPGIIILEPNTTEFLQEKALNRSPSANNMNPNIFTLQQELKHFSQLKNLKSNNSEKNSRLTNYNSQHNLGNSLRLYFTDRKKSKLNLLKNKKIIQNVHLDYGDFTSVKGNSKTKVGNLKELASLNRNFNSKTEKIGLHSRNPRINIQHISFNTSYSLLNPLKRDVAHVRKSLGQKPIDSKENQPFLNLQTVNCSTIKFKSEKCNFTKRGPRSSNGETIKQSKGRSNLGEKSLKMRKFRKNSKRPTDNGENLKERRHKHPTGIQRLHLNSQRFKSDQENSPNENVRISSKLSRSVQIWRKVKNSRHICQRFKIKQEHDMPSSIENCNRSKRDVENLNEETLLEFTEQLKNKNPFLNYEIAQKNHTILQDLKPIFQILREKLKISQLKLLEKFIKIKTLVIFGSREILTTAVEISDWNYPPLLIISKLNHWQLRDYHDSNILSVVFLKETFNESVEILEILRKSLYRWHMKKILFIVPQEQMHGDLFKWCHRQGFWNSMLMDPKGNSLVFNHLYNEIINNVSLEEFLKQSIKWNDLNGYKIRCFMANNPPRAYIFNNSLGNIDYKGYYGTVLTMFAKHYNASLIPVVLADLSTYRELDCLNYLQDNVVDVCGDALNSGPTYAITNTEEMSSSMLMVPYDTPLPRFLYFFKPFQLHVWLIVITSALYKIITLAFIHRIQHGTWNTSLQIVYATLSVIHLPFNLTRVKGNYRRFLEIVLITVGFVVANWYLAVLSSLLLSRLYHKGINSLEDLKRYNISIMVNDFEYYQLEFSAHDPIIMEQALLVTTDVLHEHRRNLDDNYAYYNQYDKIDFYLYQQKYLQRPRMKVLSNNTPMNSVLGGIPMQPNWPFEHLLNHVTRHILDNGLFLKIIDDSMIDGIRRGDIQYFPTEYYDVEPLSIEYFHMPAMLLAVGYTLAFGGFLLEMLLIRMKSGDLIKKSKSKL